MNTAMRSSIKKIVENFTQGIVELIVLASKPVTVNNVVTVKKPITKTKKPVKLPAVKAAKKPGKVTMAKAGTIPLAFQGRGKSKSAAIKAMIYSLLSDKGMTSADIYASCINLGAMNKSISDLRLMKSIINKLVKDKAIYKPGKETRGGNWALVK